MLSIAYLRTLFTASFVAVVIAACGGSSGDSATSPQNDSAVNQPVSQDVLGPDVDADGIRDDVQLYIEDKYAGDGEKMRATKRVAIADRKVLFSLDDSTELLQNELERMKATICWLRLFEDGIERGNAASAYVKVVVNTSERKRARMLEADRISALVLPSIIIGGSGYCP